MTIQEDKILKSSVADELINKKISAKKEWLVVAGILVLALIIAILLFVFKPRAEKLPLKNEAPLAEYVVANELPVSIPVFSQGSIKAKTHIKLVAEVSGRIKNIAQLKSNGGFFKKGELLLSVDDVDYRLAITKSRAQVSSAEQQLARVKTEAGQARYDLKQIGRDPSASSSYALRKPHLAEAEANLQAAKADLEISKLQLERTKVTAPFDGRVVSKQVDVGQYVTPGVLMADIYSTEMVEVRLPLSLYQTELLGLGLRNNQGITNSISVTLTSEYSSKQYQWPAKLSHTEGELDSRNRLVFAVAEINSPYSKDANNPEKPPLTPGMFVKAELTGKAKMSVIVLPRAALRYAGEVWLIDEENRLNKKIVELYSKDRDSIYVKSGLRQGDRIIINAIDFPIEGMKLEFNEAESIETESIETKPTNTSSQPSLNIQKNTNE